MTDEKKILSIEAIEEGDVDFDRYILSDPKTKVPVGEALITEGDNGKTHGQKGHRKAYLAFQLDKDGKLTDITVTVPSSGQHFTFF